MEYLIQAAMPYIGAGGIVSLILTVYFTNKQDKFVADIRDDYKDFIKVQSNNFQERIDSLEEKVDKCEERHATLLSIFERKQ
jgi:cell division septum initiation protein DivIVA